ncbi:efflux RND transporter periplasmic adaptor subunit [Altericista sp. CCNU0014]|uniref:efflux RND transporter periplasmic adaptor subunit n=1 Tax=Altericista sp. CCNU0014 TaxID=3082949 RepID=UPI00384C9B9B
MRQSSHTFDRARANLGGLFVLSSLLVGAIAGCGSLPKEEADAQTRRGQNGQQNQGPASVDVGVARAAASEGGLEYVGTTQPYRQVSLRAQVEGQLLSLRADVGDAVTQGQVLAQIDDKVLTTAVLEATAEVAALDSEVAQARAQVSDALRQVESARLELQQAEADRARFDKLYRAGAIAQQQAEQARTEAGTARQALRSAQEVVRTRQQAVSAAERRVSAQQAVIARERERQSYTTLTSPVNGVVLERVSEPGNLAQAGSEILKLGDFSQVKIAVQVSELELSEIRVGQPVRVRLDAFPKDTFSGRVSRISPVADPTARLVPIEVAIPNVGQRIGSGLLARVSFGRQAARSIRVPETAFQTNRRRGARQGGGDSSNREQPPRQAGTLYIVEGAGDRAKVAARNVTLGQRQDGQVEVTTGLRPGDRFVLRSSKPLKNGDPVRLSILSEPANAPSNAAKPAGRS